jgi:hypothetical protein
VIASSLALRENRDYFGNWPVMKKLYGHWHRSFIRLFAYMSLLLNILAFATLAKNQASLVVINIEQLG